MDFKGDFVLLKERVFSFVNLIEIDGKVCSFLLEMRSFLLLLSALLTD
jgi:hypothetical protein